jgi:hypothetical protein
VLGCRCKEEGNLERETTMSKTQSGRHEVMEIEGKWFIRPLWYACPEPISSGFKTEGRALAAAEGLECDDEEKAKDWARLSHPEQYETPRGDDGSLFDVFADEENGK